MAWAPADRRSRPAADRRRLSRRCCPGLPAPRGTCSSSSRRAAGRALGPLQEPRGQRPGPSWRRRSGAGRRPGLPARLSSDTRLFDSASVPRRDGHRRELLPAGPEAARHGRPWAPGARVLVVWVPGLQGTGSVVVPHGLSCSLDVGSSRVRDQTRVSCTGRRILYREAQPVIIIRHVWFQRCAL